MNSPPRFEPISTKSEVFLRPKDFKPAVGHDVKLTEYTVAAYVYCTSSRPDQCQPNAVIIPEEGDIAEIKNVLNYAAENGLSVAVRSGGHHFGGFSSTYGNDVQLSMRKFKSITYNNNDKTFTVGAGALLEGLHAAMQNEGAFIPHGMCTWVACGGHLQSGGFSKDIGRSFGWFIDHVTEFTVVLPPKSKGEKVIVKTLLRPTKDTPQDDKDLWFAMLGGSPGNFGVVTYMTFKPLWDTDYPDARTESMIFPYEPTQYQQITEFLAKYSRNENLAADFNLSSYVFGATPELIPSESMNIDIAMSEDYKEIYGPTFPWLPIPVMGLMGCWTNLAGSSKPFEKDMEAQAFFKDLKDLKAKIWGEESMIEKIERWTGLNLANVPMHEISSDKPYAISKATLKLCFKQRNQPNPYVSCPYIGPGDLPSGFAQWISGIVKEAVDTEHVWPDVGMVVMGGKMRREFAAANTALAHRDQGFLNMYYAHYNDVVNRKDTEIPRVEAINNCELVARGAIQNFSSEKRWNMFPPQIREGDESLDKKWEYYFDDEKTYLRVLKIKRAMDPLDIFTPNTFCVGASKKYDSANLKEGDPAMMTVETIEELIKKLHNEEEKEKEAAEVAAPQPDAGAARRAACSAQRALTGDTLVGKRNREDGRPREERSRRVRTG